MKNLVYDAILDEDNRIKESKESIGGVFICI
jgi:hypothetical protein